MIEKNIEEKNTEIERRKKEHREWYLKWNGWAKLYTDRSQETKYASNLLNEAGFRVYTYPATRGLELRIDGEIYLGLNEIKEFLEDHFFLNEEKEEKK
jgi:hypothetical protein